MNIKNLVDVDELKQFYSVESDYALIVAMFNHIDKLQDKLRKLQPPEPAVTRVRA